MTAYDEWDSSADWYDQNMGEQGDALNREVLRPVLLEMLGELSGRTLLDCGCGSGYLSAELARRALRVIGTDFSGSFVELCRRKYGGIANLEFLQHDLSSRLPLEPGAVDVLLCKMVLQYVPQIQTFAEESGRVLKPGGCLLLAVDHPFHAQFLYAQQLAGRPEPKYSELSDYFDGRPQTKLSLWGRVALTWYPRTVSQYLRPFLASGFRLVEMRELPEARDGVAVPRILVIELESRPRPRPSLRFRT